MPDEEGTPQRKVHVAQERPIPVYSNERVSAARVNTNDLVICTELELADFAQLVSQGKVSTECPHIPPSQRNYINNTPRSGSHM